MLPYMIAIRPGRAMAIVAGAGLGAIVLLLSGAYVYCAPFQIVGRPYSGPAADPGAEAWWTPDGLAVRTSGGIDNCAPLPKSAQVIGPQQVRIVFVDNHGPRLPGGTVLTRPRLPACAMVYAEYVFLFDDLDVERTLPLRVEVVAEGGLTRARTVQVPASTVYYW